MLVDSVDFFYASMPEVTLEADGSQDALLVRVVGDDGSVGWGECEASPLTSIAAFVTPRSHGVCQPVAASIIGERVDSVSDIYRLSTLLGRNSMDLLQAARQQVFAKQAVEARAQADLANQAALLVHHENAGQRLGVLAIALAWSVAVGRKEANFGEATWLAATIFSVISVRTFMPGSPPIGAYLDALFIIPAILALFLSMTLLVVFWLARRTADDPAEEGP